MELGNKPLKHNHVPTKAETMTISFAEKKGGGQLLGEYCVGNKILVSSDNQYHISQRVSISPYAVSEVHHGLTYPLYGENVLDWRTPEKTHNNIPPCSNIMVKYKPSTRRDV